MQCTPLTTSSRRFPLRITPEIAGIFMNSAPALAEREILPWVCPKRRILTGETRGAEISEL